MTEQVEANQGPPAEEPAQNGLVRKTERTLLGVLVLLGVHALYVLVMWAGWIGTKHRVDGVEVLVLNTVLTWKAGHPPYTYLDHLPATWNPYGPLYQWLCVLLPSPTATPYLMGRLLSLFSFLLATGGIAYLAWRRDRRWMPGVLAGLLVLTGRPIFWFAPIYRVDMLVAALSMLGFLLVVYGKRGWAVGAGVVLLALAVQAKLTAGIGLLAALPILWQEDRRKAVAVAAAWGVLAAAGVAATQWATHGAYLYDVRLLQGNRADPLKALEMMLRPVTTSGLWLGALAYAWWKLGSEPRRALLPALLYAGIALVAGGIGGLHPGSSWNYLIDFYVGLGLLTALLLGWLWRERAYPVLGTVLVILAAHSVFALGHTYVALHHERRKGLSAYHRNYLRAQRIMKASVPPGKRVAIVNSDLGTDVLLARGRFNPISFPPKRLVSEQNLLVERALREGELDLVLEGRALRPWTPETQPGGGQAPGGEGEGSEE